MKKLILLVLSLFIIGCDNSTTESGSGIVEPEVVNICVTSFVGVYNPPNDFTDWSVWRTYDCYTDVSEIICSAYATGDKSLKYYGSSYTCEEYCDSGNPGNTGYDKCYVRD